MVQETTISLSSIITTISIIALIVTYLLGELSAEDRMSRDRLKPVYKRYLWTLISGLGLALLALIAALLYQFELCSQIMDTVSVVLFSLAIFDVSISIFLLCLELMGRY